MTKLAGRRIAEFISSRCQPSKVSTEKYFISSEWAPGLVSSEATRMNQPQDVLPQLLASHETEILKDWLAVQVRDRGSAHANVREDTLHKQSNEFFGAFKTAVRSGSTDIQDSSWEKTREVLTDIATQQAKQ